MFFYYILLNFYYFTIQSNRQYSLDLHLILILRLACFIILRFFLLFHGVSYFSTDLVLHMTDVVFEIQITIYFLYLFNTAFKNIYNSSYQMRTFVTSVLRCSRSTSCKYFEDSNNNNNNNSYSNNRSVSIVTNAVKLILKQLYKLLSLKKN